MKCPYCGAEVVLKDASFVYHKDKTQKKLKGETVDSGYQVKVVKEFAGFWD